MGKNIMSILEFEDEIFSEYEDIRERISMLEEKRDMRDVHRAVALINLLKLDIRKTGILPTFYEKLDQEIKDFIEQNPEKINTHDCVNCSLKHVSSAAVIINEILNGYENTDHEIFLMGNLNEASEQIAEVSIELSNELRDIRVDIFETTQKITQSHLKKVKEIYRKIRALTDVKMGKEIQEKQPMKINTEKKPCGCGGK